MARESRPSPKLRVASFDRRTLFSAGSVKEAKARNMQRLEGKDYIVKDGDVLLFRFNV